MTPHIKLNLVLPLECKQELLSIEDYYTLKYSTTSSGHAFRSFSKSPSDVYNIRNKNNYTCTTSWNKIPNTTQWITNNLCDESNLGMVCLNKLSAGGSVKWHSHGSYQMKIVHFSLITNDLDLSEVRKNDEIFAMNYPEREGYIFNSFLDHRSTNFSEHDRIHLVVECNSIQLMI